jgi:hypothetical protein
MNLRGDLGNEQGKPSAEAAAMREMISALKRVKRR